MPRSHRGCFTRTASRYAASFRALVVAGALSPGFAVAARAADQPTATQVPEVVVTANKRETALQNLPQPVTAVTGEQLGKMGISDFRDLATSVPGLTFVPTSDTTTKIVIRGISTGNLNDAASSGTGLYLDDVPMGSAYGPGGTDINIIDLARVEVLRGPQGTLYGAGSMGGTVRYVTRQPDLSHFSGNVDWEGTVVDGATSALGSYVDGVLNAPLVTDRLGLRIVAYDRNDQGWISSPTRGVRQVNGVNLWGGRATLRWDVNDRWSVTLMGLYQDTHSDGGPYVDESVTKQPLAGDLTQSGSAIPTPGHITSTIVNLVVEGDLGWAKFTSSSSYSDFDRHQAFDDTQIFPFNLGPLLVPGTTSVPEVFYSEDRDYAEELRLTSSGSGPLSWLAGVFLQDYGLPGDRAISTAGGPVVSLLNGSLVQHRDTYAVFGEGSYEFAAGWTLTLGGRFARVDSKYSQGLSGALIGAPLINNTSESSNYFTPKVELSYKPNANDLFYVMYSEGYRPGGSNLHYNTITVPSTYAADTVKNYEAGAKTTWLDRKLTANLSVYYEDFNNLQVVASAAGLPYFANAGTARSVGVELELTARPIEGLVLQGSATYDDAKFTSNAPTLPAFQGEVIPQVPLWSASASVDYTWPVRGRTDAFVHLDGRYAGSSSAGTGPLYGINLDAYGVLNARAGLNFGHAQVALFIDNLTNVRAQLGAGPILSTPSFAPITSINFLRMTVLRPLTVGVKVGYAF